MSRSSYPFLVCLSVFAALSSSCGKKKSEDGAGGGAVTTERTSSDFQPKEGQGCVQGTVVNGLSGEKLNLKEAAGLGVFVLIRGVKFKAAIVQNPAEEIEAGLAGEYFICGIPLDESYLIFAHFDGYLPFQSEIKIQSTTLTADENDLRKPDPLLLANIRMFPKGETTKDLKVTVYNDAAPVKGAMVRVEPAGANELFGKDGFLAPNDSRLVPLPEDITSDDGKVNFAKEQLVLGARYKYKVIPPADSNLQVAQGEFVLGVSTAGAQARDYYEFGVNLATSVQPLALVSCSNREVDFNKSGTLVFTFNRELVHVDLDDPTATLVDSGSRGGNDTVDSVELVVDADDNDDKSEQVKVDVSGKILTLNPRYVPEKKTPDVKTDAGLQIVYDPLTIKLKVKDGEAADNAGPTTLDALIKDKGCKASVFYFAYKGVPK